MKQVLNVSLSFIKSFVCVWIFYTLFVGSSVAHETEKALTCKDPDTGEHHAVNTTWPSTTFCGNYSCQVRYKYNSTNHQHGGSEGQTLNKINVTVRNKTSCGKPNAEIDREKLKKLLLLMADIQTNELRKFAESLESPEKAGEAGSEDDSGNKNKHKNNEIKPNPITRQSDEKADCSLKHKNLEKIENTDKDVAVKLQKSWEASKIAPKSQHFNVPTLTNRHDLSKSLQDNEYIKKYLTTFYPNRKLQDRPVYYYVPYVDPKSQARHLNSPTSKQSSSSTSVADTTIPPAMYGHEFKFIPYYITRQNCDYNNQPIVPMVKPFDTQNKLPPVFNQLFYSGNDYIQQKNARYNAMPKLYFDKNNKNIYNPSKLKDIFSVSNNYKLNKSISNPNVSVHNSPVEQNYKTEYNHLGNHLASANPTVPIRKDEVGPKKKSLQTPEMANRLKTLPRIKMIKRNYENIFGKVTKEPNNRLSIRQPEMEWKNDSSLFQEHTKTNKVFPPLKTCERCKRSVITEEDEKSLPVDDDGAFETYITIIGCTLDPEPGYFRTGNTRELYPKCCPQKIPDR